MPNISIDVDLDEFDTDDLAEELYYRIDRSRYSERSVDRLMKQVKLLHTQFFENDDAENALPVHSVLDQMKVEYMQQIFEKYTLTQIENALPL